MSIQFIDIHSHKKSDNSNVLALVNIAVLPTEEFEIFQYNSIGIHPWDISKIDDVAKALLFQRKLLQNQAVVMIGECGLDKLIDTDFEEQIEIFETQLQLAKECNMPIVVHCVKAFYDVIASVKKEKIQTPIIFHNFSGNRQTRDALLQYNTYFSFGAKVFSQEKLPQTLRETPLHRLFLETDSADVSIEMIYEKVSNILDISIEELQKVIKQNFEIVFPNIKL